MSTLPHAGNSGSLSSGRVYTSVVEFERLLEHAKRDSDVRTDMFGTLLTATVYLVGSMMVLEENGPVFEIPIARHAGQPAILVYSSPSRAPSALDADAVPFAYLLKIVDAGLPVVVNPCSSLEHEISADEMELLRRVMMSLCG